MADPGSFLLDANLSIQAKNSYYAFTICPGFWNSLVGHFELGSLCSIDHIRQELLRGNDELAEWVKTELPNEFSLETGEVEIRKKYQEIILWVQRNPQFFDLAKADFAASADGWLLAYAQAKNLVVVTQEQLAPDVKNRVPIPNACEQFRIQYKDTFFMLNALNVEFEWKTYPKIQH